MKYVIDIGENEFVKEVAWFTETMPLVTLETNSIKKAKLFDEKEIIKKFQNHYPYARIIPIQVSIG